MSPKEKENVSVSRSNDDAITSISNRHLFANGAAPVIGTPQHNKAVGILGGMGPEATVDLMTRVIAKTPANVDQDHIRLLVDNNPHVPSRIAAILEGTGQSPVPCLQSMAQGLEKQGAKVLAMPCNTAHFYYPDIAKAVSVPVLNMIALTVAEVKRQYPNARSIGLLGSTSLLKTDLYKSYCEAANLTLIYPNDDEQDEVMSLIKAIKSRSKTPEQLDRYVDIAGNLLGARGADCLVVACTELSVVDDALSSSTPISSERPALKRIDALDVLASAIVAFAR